MRPTTCQGQDRCSKRIKNKSDALQGENDIQAINRANLGLKPYQPDGIVDGKTLLSLVTTPNLLSDHDPFKDYNNSYTVYGTENLQRYCCGSGISKSSFCQDITASLLQTGERVGYLKYEESNTVLLSD